MELFIMQPPPSKGPSPEQKLFSHFLFPSVVRNANKEIEATGVCSPSTLILIAGAIAEYRALAASFDGDAALRDSAAKLRALLTAQGADREPVQDVIDMIQDAGGDCRLTSTILRCQSDEKALEEINEAIQELALARYVKVAHDFAIATAAHLEQALADLKEGRQASLDFPMPRPTCRSADQAFFERTQRWMNSRLH